MKRKYLFLSGATSLLILSNLQAAACILGTADDFAVLGGSTVTNTGSSIITGDVGVSPGSAITGFPPGNVFGGTIYSADAVAAQAQVDLTRAYNGLAGMPVTSNLTGHDLGGLVLTSGVYHFDSVAQLTGTLMLNAQGQDNAYWVFQIGSTLTTASNSLVSVINPGSNDGKDYGVFWQVGSSATLGTTTTFEGNILALTSITLNTGATDSNGRMLARNGAVTLDTNIISNVCPNGGPGYNRALMYDTNGTTVIPVVPVVPEPGTASLFFIGATMFLLRRKHQNCRE